MPATMGSQTIPETIQTAATAKAKPQNALGWFERLWNSIAERGRKFAPIPSRSIDPVERAKILASALLSERGEASGAAVARELLQVLGELSIEQRLGLMLFLAEGFQPDAERLASAARAYLNEPTPKTAGIIAQAAEPPRQELLRRMNMASGGTLALVMMRKEIGKLLRAHPALAPLDADLRHLFISWFNRGFLELKQIDWQTPAAILEKLIAYEAVHEIAGWEDLRRRLAPDRRCFAFFHPALPGEPLIFVEVALVKGLAGSMRELLERDTDEAIQRQRVREADTAIFYSISNCQDGLRGISFGNFLIKQVVEELQAEMPGLQQYSTLSPVPGFRTWLDQRLASTPPPDLALGEDERTALTLASGQDAGKDTATALSAVLATAGWENSAITAEAVRPALERLCAVYLTRSVTPDNRSIDPVAKFHLNNGAKLERINWMGNPGPRGLRESWGIMVNYLYNPALIEANHEIFARRGEVARSAAVDALAEPPPAGTRRSRRVKREVRALPTK